MSARLTPHVRSVLEEQLGQYRHFLTDTKERLDNLRAQVKRFEGDVKTLQDRVDEISAALIDDAEDGES